MNKSYSFPFAYQAFSFTSASSMGLHVSTSHIFYPLWEPCTSPLSSTVGNIITPFLGLFQYYLCGLLWASLLQYTVPAPTAKGTCTAPFAKNFQVHTPRFGIKLRKVCPTPPWALIPLVGGNKHHVEFF